MSPDKKSAIWLGVDQFATSKDAVALLQMSGLPFKVSHDYGSDYVPWMDFAGHYVRRLTLEGGIEWFMKGIAPLAFDLYHKGIRPPVNTPFKCLLTDDPRVSIEEQALLSFYAGRLLEFA